MVANDVKICQKMNNRGQLPIEKNVKNGKMKNGKAVIKAHLK